MKRRTIWLIPLMLVSLLFLGCPTDGNGEAVWLADLSNPFLGKWQSDIPSAGMTLIFDYKTDGTFDYEIPGLPVDQGGQGTGGYIVYEDKMVTWLDIEGAAAYTFKVVGNNTINVTELEPDDEGELVPGNTAPFRRVAGSAVNRENKPLVLSNPFIGGNWESLIPSMDNARMVSEYKANGECTVIFPDVPAEYGGGVLYTGCYIIYEDKFISYVEGDGLGAFTFSVTNANSINVTEIEEVQEDGTIVSGNTSTFTHIQ
jgi:hypothetical protein